jgi:hypothetical protein
MASSGTFRRVALVRNHVSKELSASFIRVTRIGELGTKPAVTSNRRTQLISSETTVITRATRRNIPEDAILHSHRRENLKSYKPTVCSISRWTYSTGREILKMVCSGSYLFSPIPSHFPSPHCHCHHQQNKMVYSAPYNNLNRRIVWPSE